MSEITAEALLLLSQVYEVKQGSNLVEKVRLFIHKVTGPLHPKVNAARPQNVKPLSHPFSREKQHLWVKSLLILYTECGSSWRSANRGLRYDKMLTIWCTQKWFSVNFPFLSWSNFLGFWIKGLWWCFWSKFWSLNKLLPA